MKKGTRILVLTLCSLILISFLIGVVSAAETANTLINRVSNLLSGEIDTWSNFIENILSKEVLFGILIFLIVFAILANISLFKSKPGINLSISIIISILAAGFVKPEWYSAIINQYEALGITISFLIPFILIFYFIKEIIPTQRTLQHLIWGIYTAILAVSFYSNYNAEAMSSLAKSLYWIIILLSVIMVIFGVRIINFLFKEELKSALTERTREAEASLTAQIAQDQRKLEELSGSARTALERKIARNEEALAKLRVK